MNTSDRILIVDDEPAMLILLEYSLQADGYAVDTAYDGEEALRKVRVNMPDLVILDVMMPGLSGFEVCSRLRNDPETANLPIILLSAKDRVSDKVSGIKAGADEYVTKPISMDELTARVGGLLERTRRVRQNKPVKRGKVLGFLGAKGGVGTTTVAANIALALSQNETTVAVVELRPSFGTLSFHLGRTPVGNLKHLLDIEPEHIDERELRKRLISHSNNLRALIGPQTKDIDRRIGFKHAKAIVSGLASIVDYTIIDLPSHPSRANQAALQQSDFVIMVTGLDPASIESAKLSLRLLESWGLDRRMIGITVVSPVESGTDLTLAEVESQVGAQIVATIPAAPEMCLEALTLRSGLVIYRPNSPVAQALFGLANWLAESQVSPQDV